MNSERVSEGMARREFLRVSSVAAVGVLAVTVADHPLLAAPAPLEPLLWVGYVPSLPAIGASTPIAFADALTAPDREFISRGARVTVHGGGRAVRHKTTRGGLSLDAIMPSPSREPEDFPHFHAWSVNGRDSYDSLSGRGRFTMPVMATTGLTFVVRHQTGLPDARVSSTPFSTTLSHGRGPKLQRGVYIVAMRESASDAAYDWRRVALVNVKGVYSIPDATFGYVILAVDYGDSELTSAVGPLASHETQAV